MSCGLNVAAFNGLTQSNVYPAIGGPWGNATQGYATTTTDVNADHSGIAGSQMMTSLFGLTYTGAPH
jgi:hypothetical protein